MNQDNQGYGKTALITGASGGIGAELARLFAKDGTNLILVARSKDKLDALKTELEAPHNISVTVFAEDLTRQDAAQSLYDFTQTQHLSVDFLVNNAGFGDWGLFADCNLEKQQQMMQLNIVTLTNLTKLFLPHMISRKSGRILNVASVASFMPGAKMSVYYASKAFVRSFSEALSVELKQTKSGVTVTALCPGPVKTDFWNRAEAEKSSIFSHMLFATSDFIARYGYKKMLNGKPLAIPGITTQAAVLLTKLLPRSWVRNMVYFVQK